MIPLDELQPFLDLLKSRGLLTHEMSAEEVAEGLRYFVNVKKARHFVEMGTANLACPACGDDGTNPACENFSALVAFGHPRADEWMGVAWDRAALESPWAAQRGAPAARRTGFETVQAEVTGERILAGFGRVLGRNNSLVEEMANTFARVLNRMTDEAVMMLGGSEGLQLAQFNNRREIRRDGVPLWFVVYEMGPDAIRITEADFTEADFTEYAPDPLRFRYRSRIREAARGIVPAI